MDDASVVAVDGLRIVVYRAPTSWLRLADEEGVARRYTRRQGTDKRRRAAAGPYQEPQ